MTLMPIAGFGRYKYSSNHLIIQDYKISIHKFDLCFMDECTTQDTWQEISFHQIFLESTF